MTYYGQLAFNKINPGGNFELKDESFFDKDYEKSLKKINLLNMLFYYTNLMLVNMQKIFLNI